MRERIDQFLTFLTEEEQYSANTVAAYRNDLIQFLDWLCEQAEARQSWQGVRAEDVTNYLFYLRGREYAASTVARKMAAVKSFFGHLTEQEELVENPCAEVNTPKVKKHVPQALSREGVARLIAQPARLKNSKGLRDCAMLELLYATGMRVSELVNLVVEDVDLAQWTLHCGSGANERIVPIAPRAGGALVAYLETGRPQLTQDEQERTLFLNMRGSQLTRQGLWLIIKHYVEQAGIQDDVTPHTLRHSFAIHKLRDGMELSEMQERLGHANISTTQMYTQSQATKG